jgi:aldose 1-epimerase
MPPVPPPHQSHPYGVLPTGETVHWHTLTNRHGGVVQIINYGAIITALHVPDRNGTITNVCLGCPDLAGYLERHPYYGAIVGRVAGRITGGRFTLEGRPHELVINDPPNHLHGGLVGFDRKLWSSRASVDALGQPRLHLGCHSADGEEGYPGNVEVELTYTWTHEHTLIVDLAGRSDQATPYGLTQHAYFNLAGAESGTVHDHVLQIHAQHYVPTDEHLTLLPRLKPVAGTAADFYQPRRLGDALPHLWKQHGDTYRLSPPAPGDTLVRAAHVSEPTCGRTLTVFTNDPYLQFYTGVYLPLAGRPAHAGLCLEAERHPDGVNQPALGDNTLRPGEVCRQITHYAFGVTA